jgi:hypothetical protein
MAAIVTSDVLHRHFRTQCLVLKHGLCSLNESHWLRSQSGLLVPSSRRMTFLEPFQFEDGSI